jgi:3-phosphoshikimate 1-carboxyvinyltransferase
MQVTVKSSNISGEVQAPLSKSIMQRLCAAALVSDGTTIIMNPGKSNDDKAALSIIEKLGALIISHEDGALEISKNEIKISKEKIDCGESGLSIRMFTPIAALSNEEILISGHGSLLKRPMDFFDKILPSLGVEVKSNKGYLPLRVKGPLIPRNIEIEGSVSSQFLSGLLFAFVAAKAEGVTIKVKNLKSKPYIDLTLHVLKQFGAEIINNDYKEFYFPHSSTLNGKISFVEADWSGAAFLLVAGAIVGNVTVKGLNLNSIQADKAIIEVLKECGAKVLLNQAKITIEKNELKPFHFDASDCPDLFPPLVALAAHCNGVSVLKGISRLVHKESNRAATLQQEFEKIGINIQLFDDIMIINGGDTVHNSQVNSHNDHRIAMACAVAGLSGNGKMIIDNAEAIEKSYPDFYKDLMDLGAKISSGETVPA